MGGSSSKPTQELSNVINTTNNLAVSLYQECINEYSASISNETAASASNDIDTIKISGNVDSNIDNTIKSTATVEVTQTYTSIYNTVMDSNTDAATKLDVLNGLINTAINEGNSLFTKQQNETNNTINQTFNMSNSVDVINKISNCVVILTVASASASNKIKYLEINNNVGSTIKNQIIAEAKSKAQQLADCASDLATMITNKSEMAQKYGLDVSNDSEVKSLAAAVSEDAADVVNNTVDTIGNVANNGIDGVKDVLINGTDALASTAKTGIWATFGTTGIVIAVIVGLILLLVLGGFAIFVFKKLMNTATTGGYDDDDL